MFGVLRVNGGRFQAAQSVGVCVPFGYWKVCDFVSV